MQFKVVTIPTVGDPDAEEELNRFLRGHRVVSVEVFKREILPFYQDINPHKLP